MFVQALHDSNFDVAHTAANALKNRAYRPENPRDAAAYHVALENLQVVARYGEDAVQPLVTLLRSHPDVTNPKADTSVRYDAMTLAASLGQEALVPAVASYLDSNYSGKTRALAAYTLGEMRSPAALDALERSLLDNDDDVRREAARALGAIGDARAVPALAGALTDLDGTVRKIATDALGVIGTDEAIEHVETALAEKDVGMVQSAVSTMERFGRTPPLELLVPLLDDQRSDVSGFAIRALGAYGEAAVEHLIPILESSHDDWRSIAVATALQEIGTEEAIDAITKKFWAMTRRSPDGRRVPMSDDGRRLLALLEDAGASPYDDAPEGASSADPSPQDGESGMAQASRAPMGEVETLVVQLQDKDWWIRKVAAERLGQIEGADVVPFLIQALKDEDARVKAAAARALAGKKDERAILHLVAVLKEESDEAREAARLALGVYDEALLEEPLRLAAKDPSMQKGVVEAIPVLEAPVAVDLLVDMVSSADPVETHRIADALTTFDADDVVPSLVTLLESDQPEVAVAALRCLVRFPADASVHEAVTTTAAHPDVALMTRGEAIHILESLPGDVSIPAAVSLLHDHNFSIRERAADVLEGLAYSPDTETARVDYLIAQKNFDAVIAMGRVALEPLIELLGTSDVSIAASSSGAPTTPIRAARPSHGPHDYKARAAEALGQLADPTAISALTGLLQDRDHGQPVVTGRATMPTPSLERRQQAILALLQIGGPDVVAPIVDALDDPDDSVARYAAYALGELGLPEAVDPLVQSLKRPELAEQALEALAALNDPRSVEPLVGALPSSGNPEPIIQTLRTIGDPRSVEPLIAFARTAEGSAKTEAVAAIASFRDPASVEFLIDALKDDDLVKFAAPALAEMGVRDAVEPLGAVLKRHEAGADEFEHAAEALRALTPESIPQLVYALSVRGRRQPSNELNTLVKCPSDLVVEQLFELFLHAETEEEILRAILAMQAYGDGRMVPTLVEIVRGADKPERLRTAAVRTIESFDPPYTPETTEALTNILTNEQPTWELHRAASQALIKIQPDAARDAIAQWRDRWRDDAPKRTWDEIAGDYERVRPRPPLRPTPE